MEEQAVREPAGSVRTTALQTTRAGSGVLKVSHRGRQLARALAKLATCVYPDSNWHIAASLVKARAEQA
ncbi:hypothetical protein GCM10009810_12330 [Nostocoides vanveenii]|uniref:Transposase n=1 Tax=Nostocoides vanveenii TaxID=330835 RepID=A0ABP4WLR4_9MICO